MFKVLTLNNIAQAGLARLPADHYRIGDDIKDPDAILLRSAKMHDMEIPRSLRVVGRAGAGINNIPVSKMTERGVPVFNAPGANANAVKELVMAGLVLGCRHICQAWNFARSLDGSDEEMHKAVEAGKKNFSGCELPGRTLGVIGLGAVGRIVANAGVALGMKAVGYDPGLTVEGAWQLSADVKRARSVDEVLRSSDFVTFHVPLTDTTRDLVNAERLKLMKDGVVILNFAREGIVDDGAVVQALNAGKASAYISDFPSNATKQHPHVIALPHLGASTQEAEENCAVMVVDQVRDFLENGNIRNAVNFPEVVVPRATRYRLTCANVNVPNMLGRISEAFGQANVRIHDMVDTCRGEMAYAVVDLVEPAPETVVKKLAAIQGVLAARLIEPPPPA